MLCHLWYLCSLLSRQMFEKRVDARLVMQLQRVKARSAVYSRFIQRRWVEFLDAVNCKNCEERHYSLVTQRDWTFIVLKNVTLVLVVHLKNICITRVPFSVVAWVVCQNTCWLFKVGHDFRRETLKESGSILIAVKLSLTMLWYGWKWLGYICFYPISRLFIYWKVLLYEGFYLGDVLYLLFLILWTSLNVYFQVQGN